jgi:hypothetical protein
MAGSLTWSLPGCGWVGVWWREDLVGGLGPAERLAALVPAITESADRLHQLSDAGEGAAADGLAGDDPKEDLDQVQPARRGRSEMQLDAGMFGQPGPHGRGLVGGVVVQHQMQLTARIGAGDLLEEGGLVAIPAGRSGVRVPSPWPARRP